VAINPKAVLCYVEGSKAYFTTQALADQWGDDWDHVPYEHNAETPNAPCWHNYPVYRNNPDAKRGWRPGTQEPYAVGEMCRCDSCKRDWNEDGTPKWELFSVHFEGPWETPADRAYCNSSWSVRDINAGHIAWLLPERWSETKAPPIPAGTTYEQFREIVLEFGTLYEPVEAE
jgi:hypothetical protein